MTTDLEADLRREFDAAGMPSGLTFHAESVLRQGSRIIRRRRIIAVGSAAMTVAVVATGASLLTRPDDKALPLPASTSSPTPATGIVRAQSGVVDGTFDVEFNRDTRVASNVRYFFTPQDGRRQEIGSSSSGKPGQKPDAVWRSGIVDGHPVTLGLVPSPSSNVAITFADGGLYGVGIEDLKGTGFSMFYVDYTPAPGDTSRKEPRRPSEIANIRWSGPTGIVDGIEGDHRLTGRVLDISKTLSVEVVLRPGDGGRTTVFGKTHLVRDSGGGAGFPMSVATTDAAGVAVVTGREPYVRKNANGIDVLNAGPPMAAGILPPGVSEILAINSSGDVSYTSGRTVSGTRFAVLATARLPDGRVIFAIRTDAAPASAAGTDSIRAVTWTNADGSQGRINVTQKQG